MTELLDNRFEALAWAGRTDRGHKREVNEDRLILIPEAGVYGVADGIGGGDAGDTASSLVASCLQTAFYTCPDHARSLPLDERVELAVSALTKANEAIREHTRREQLNTCGSTVVVLLLDHEHPDQARVIHAGDSRLYIQSGGVFSCLTTDHNAANEYSEEILTKLDARQHQHITRAVGIQEKLNTTITELSVKPGDRFLICTDGLHGMCDPLEGDQRAAWLHGVPVDDAVENLLSSALRNGGRDNVSLVIVDPHPEYASTVTAVGAGGGGNPGSIRHAEPWSSAKQGKRLGAAAAMMARIVPPRHRLRTLAPIIVAAMAALAVVIGIGLYERLMTSRYHDAVLQLKEGAEIPDIGERLHRLQEVAARSGQLASKDFRKSRWRDIGSILAGSMSSIREQLDADFMDALDGITMDGPANGFFQHVEQITEKCNMTEDPEVAKFWGEETLIEMSQRTRDMKDIIKVIRYWDVLQAIQQVNSQEELEKGEALLSRIKALDRHSNLYAMRLQQNPVMAGLSVYDLAAAHQSELENQFAGCVIEEVMEMASVPGLDLEAILNEYGLPVSPANQKAYDALIETNRSRLDRLVYLKQLKAFVPASDSPESFRQELRYLGDLKAVLIPQPAVNEGEG